MKRVRSIDPKRNRKKSRRGAKGNRTFCEVSFLQPERLNALIRRAEKAQRGVEAVEVGGAREIRVDNGCLAKRAPRIGVETEAERRSRRSNGFKIGRASW